MDRKLLQVQELISTLEILRQKVEEMSEVSFERSNAIILERDHMLYCQLRWDRLNEKCAEASDLYTAILNRTLEWQ
jgi:hypothetical protein